MNRKSLILVVSSLFMFLALVLVGIAQTAAAQSEYRSAQEAFNAGAKLHAARKFAECRAPFEAALELSQDDTFKVRVYRALMSSYRQLAEIDKMLDATDFIFEHGTSAVEKSLTARSLASFVHQRGKTAEAVKLYESQLEKNPQSRPALYALTEIYRQAEPNPARRTKLLRALSKVQKQDEADLAAHFEALAVQEPQRASVHWKDAAAAWVRAKDQRKALLAVQKAEQAGPDNRNDLIAHFWHKGIGDIYMELDQPKQAIPHFEQAIKKTTIAGYIKVCEEQLTKARATSPK